MSDKNYSDSRYGVGQGAPLGQINFNSANARKAQWSPPVDEDGNTQTVRVSRVSAIVDTAGTLTGSLLEIFNGTTSLGNIAVGTSVINTRIVSGLLNTTLTTGDILNVRNNGSDATVVLRPQVEFVEGFVA